MKTKTLLASLALAGLVIAQPASAATRSIDPVDSAERIGSPVGETEELGGSTRFLLILAVFLAVGGLVVLLSDSDDPTSP